MPVASIVVIDSGVARSAWPMSAAYSSVQRPSRRSSASSPGAGPAVGGMWSGAVIGGEDTGKPMHRQREAAERGTAPATSCDPVAMSVAKLPATAAYAIRIAFIVELAGHLHRYGTTAQRLEGAIVSVARRLGLDCEPWSNPTGLILSFSDPQRPPGESDTTRVIRLPPGETNLSRLCEADRIAEEVMAGRLDIAQGHAALRALDRAADWRANLRQITGFG